jgi:hypothetical protein
VGFGAASRARFGESRVIVVTGFSIPRLPPWQHRRPARPRLAAPVLSSAGRVDRETAEGLTRRSALPIPGRRTLPPSSRCDLRYLSLLIAAGMTAMAGQRHHALRIFAVCGTEFLAGRCHTRTSHVAAFCGCCVRHWSSSSVPLRFSRSARIVLAPRFLWHQNLVPPTNAAQPVSFAPRSPRATPQLAPGSATRGVDWRTEARIRTIGIEAPAKTGGLP